MSARHTAGGLLAALAGLSCLAAAGCAAGKAAAVAAQGQPGSQRSSGTAAGTPAAASTVLPARLGDTWVYAVDSSALGKGTETARISAVTAVAGGQRATAPGSMTVSSCLRPRRTVGRGMEIRRAFALPASVCSSNAADPPSSPIAGLT